ncbi:MAG: hypothetical protein K9I85_04385 [Saprospiraceae bacterium]|nr:hypothetical protein [Saprospiraceae bacterium]
MMQSEQSPVVETCLPGWTAGLKPMMRQDDTNRYIILWIHPVWWIGANG